MQTAQTEQMPRPIRVFAGHTCHFVGFVMLRLINKTSGRNGFSEEMEHSSKTNSWNDCNVLNV